jgi:hypothetical protein
VPAKRLVKKAPKKVVPSTSAAKRGRRR